MAYSAPCSVKGCIDYNDIRTAIAEFNKANNTQFDSSLPRDIAVFVVGNGVLGPQVETPCGCEIRGGGNCVSPLHVHHCAAHSAEIVNQLRLN
jgi:hypothetical protein